MSKTRPYEEEILRTVRAMPAEALPRVLELVTIVREELRSGDKKHDALSKTSHECTRKLAASSKTNWARDLLAERDDRL